MRILSVHQLRPSNAQISNPASFHILKDLLGSYKSVEIGQTLSVISSTEDTLFKLYIEAINERSEQHGVSAWYSVT